MPMKWEDKTRLGWKKNKSLILKRTTRCTRDEKSIESPAGEDLVAHGDAGDARARAEVRHHVLLQPRLRRRGAHHRRHVLVADADYELDARAEERAQDVGAGVVQLHLADPHRPEQPRYLRRRWQVVGDLPVVDADRQGLGDGHMLIREEDGDDQDEAAGGGELAGRRSWRRRRQRSS